MGSECVLTAEQLELLTSTESRSKLPSISGEQCDCWVVWNCSFEADYVRPTSSWTHACLDFDIVVVSCAMHPSSCSKLHVPYFQRKQVLRVIQVTCPAMNSRQLSPQSQLQLHTLHASRHAQYLPPSNVEPARVRTCVSSAGDNGQRLLTPSKEEKLRALVNGLDRSQLFQHRQLAKQSCQSLAMSRTHPYIMQ